MTSAASFEVEASLREDIGKGASRRLRRGAQIPAIVYGGGKEPTSLVIEHKKIVKSLENEAFYSHILDLKIDGKTEKVILKDLQRHPFKPFIMHADFQRVRADEKIHMHVPIHFIGEDKAPGVKDSGGVISHNMSDIEIKCLPAHLPEFIEVDLSNMKLNDVIHLSDLKITGEIEIMALSHDDDKAVVSIHLPRAEEEPEEEEAAEEASEEAKAETEEKAEAEPTSEEKKED